MWPTQLEHGQFRMRRMRFSDLPMCREILAHEGVDHACLPSEAFTRGVLRTGSGIGVIFEQRQGATQTPRPLCFGITAFLPASFFDEAREVAARDAVNLVATHLATPSRLFAGWKQLASANSTTGITMLAYGSRAEKLLTAEQGLELGHLMTQGVFQSHAGYNLAGMLWVCCADEHMKYLQSAGASVYGNCAGAPPFLMGVSRQDVHDSRGSLFWRLFGYRRPVLHLTRLYQELAIAALDGRSDHEAADHLGVTLPAVKKRWAALFRHVADRSNLLDNAPPANGVRGPEKRGTLLNYLREHPEELRPFVSVQ